MTREHYFSVGDIVYRKDLRRFFRVGYVSNNGSYKLYDLYNGRFCMWSSFQDQNLTDEEHTGLV